MVRLFYIGRLHYQFILYLYGMCQYGHSSESKLLLICIVKEGKKLCRSYMKSSGGKHGLPLQAAYNKA
jgi:hypothetical protein